MMLQANSSLLHRVASREDIPILWISTHGCLPLYIRVPFQRVWTDVAPGKGKYIAYCNFLSYKTKQNIPLKIVLMLVNCHVD